MASTFLISKGNTDTTPGGNCCSLLNQRGIIANENRVSH